MGTLILALGTLGLFLGIFIPLALIGGLTRERTGVGRSLDVLDAMTTQSGSQAPISDGTDSFQDRVLFPFLNRLQGLARRFTPADANKRIQDKLELAGNPPGWTPERIAAGKVAGLIVALILSVILVLLMSLPALIAVFLVLLATIAGYLAPNMYLHQLVYDRNAAMQASLADAIDLLTISVESGLGFDAAVARVASNTSGPLAQEFARMLQEMQIGRGRSEALRSMGDRTKLPDLRAFISAMVQADSFGIPISQVLRVQASEIRVKRRQWAEEMAQKVPVKILIPLIFTILPCLFIAVLGPAALTILDSFSGTLR